VNAKALFQEGKVSEAIQALGPYLRDHPSDTANRTFLFELLCFAGEFDRAGKQLGVLARAGKDAEMGAILYYSALHAEKTRAEMFEKEEFPTGSTSEEVSGTLNGKPFTSLRDADPDMGARLEIFAAGACMWLPLRHISSIRMEAPKTLRDTLWTPAFITTGPSFSGEELGEVLIPAIYPLSWKHPDESVWLGRVTAWGADDQGVEYPSGQKMLLVDGEEFPFLELRTLEIESADGAEG
jgi:type VI secretion system protein ImpE